MRYCRGQLLDVELIFAASQDGLRICDMCDPSAGELIRQGLHTDQVAVKARTYSWDAAPGAGKPAGIRLIP